MNASALLQSQGWRGKGHSLHKTDDSVGLAKPLLLNRKDNTKGLGTTQHFTSDQWWMNAFDEQLKGLETSKEGKVTQTIKTGKLNAIENGSLGKYSLYTSFVRGGFLEGTLRMTANDDSSSMASSEKETSDETPATMSDPDEDSCSCMQTTKTAKDRDERPQEAKSREKIERRKEKQERRAGEKKKRSEEKQGQIARSARSLEKGSKEDRRTVKAERNKSKAERKRLKAETPRSERKRSKEERRARKETKRREQRRLASTC